MEIQIFSSGRRHGISLHPISVLGEIVHYNISRVNDVHVNVVDRDLGSVAADIDRVIEKMEFSNGVSTILRGPVEKMHTSMSMLGSGLAVANLMVYLVLMAQFRSFVDPPMILFFRTRKRSYTATSKSTGGRHDRFDSADVGLGAMYLFATAPTTRIGRLGLCTLHRLHSAAERRSNVLRTLRGVMLHSSHLFTSGESSPQDSDHSATFSFPILGSSPSAL
ncbi:MAG: efflux RND transporter permease subunit [Pirellulaceae bacterium]